MEDNCFRILAQGHPLTLVTIRLNICRYVYTVLNAVFLLTGTRNGQSTKTPTQN
jgi:hypothetical protein